MMPNQKNIMLRFSFIILVMVLIGIAIICKAGVIMFAERQYWKDVADRFVKENVTEEGRNRRRGKDTAEATTYQRLSSLCKP